MSRDHKPPKLCRKCRRELIKEYDQFSTGYGEIIQVILNALKTRLFGDKWAYAFEGMLKMAQKEARMPLGTRSVLKRTKPSPKGKRS